MVVVALMVVCSLVMVMVTPKFIESVHCLVVTRPVTLNAAHCRPHHGRGGVGRGPITLQRDVARCFFLDLLVVVTNSSDDGDGDGDGDDDGGGGDGDGDGDRLLVNDSNIHNLRIYRILDTHRPRLCN